MRLDLVNATGSVAGLVFDRVTVPSAIDSSVVVDKAKDISALQFVDLKVGGVCAKDAKGAGFRSSVGSGEGSAFVCTGK